jgi:hypothetical protein
MTAAGRIARGRETPILSLGSRANGGRLQMRILPFACIAVAAVVAIPYPFLQREPLPVTDLRREVLPVPDETAAIAPAQEQPAKLADDFSSDYVPHPMPSQQELLYLADYAYAEVLPDKKPADSILDSLQNISLGTPAEEIKLASDALGLDFSFMKAVARIESDFDPKQRTGSYIGLFQLSHYEFNKYGSGDIVSPRDNAIAAAYKFATAAILFELATHQKPTLYDLYLIHQQGTQGAAEHVSHPERIAWQSMCATDEGREKGEKWCKRAVWQNTLPAVKKIWKSVDNLTSGAFVAMWQERVAQLYARYSTEIADK